MVSNVSGGWSQYFDEVSCSGSPLQCHKEVKFGAKSEASSFYKVILMISGDFIITQVHAQKQDFHLDLERF